MHSLSLNFRYFCSVMTKINLLFTSALLILLGGCGGPYKQLIKELKLEDGIYSEIETDKGKIYIALEHELAPLAVANFAGLAEGVIPNKIKKEGQPFYNGLTFHRVMPDFMIQGGDPAGNGSGTPGYAFKDEFSGQLKHNKAGIVAMANIGDNSNGCQFYITLGPAPWLDGKHSIFGKVIKGEDVVNRIEAGDKIVKIIIIRVGKKFKHYNPLESFNALK